MVSASPNFSGRRYGAPPYAPLIHVSAVNDELLSAVGKLTAEYGRIGGNLNQIARYLNEYGAPYNALSGEVRAAIADLAAPQV